MSVRVRTRLNQSSLPTDFLCQWAENRYNRLSQNFKRIGRILKPHFKENPHLGNCEGGDSVHLFNVNVASRSGGDAGNSFGFGLFASSMQRLMYDRSNSASERK